MPYFGHARARSRLRLWAILVPVPETPVHEDGPTPHPIREVGRPGQISIPQTVSNTKSCHQFSHLKLRTRIGLLDRLHHARAGGRRNDVPWLYQSNILGHVDGQRSPRSLSRQVQPTASRDDRQKTCGAYKSLTIQIAVVVAAGRLSQVEAGHAGARNPHATRIERAPQVQRSQFAQERVELRLKDRLEAAKHEIAPCRSIDEEGAVLRHKEFGKGVSLDPCSDGKLTGKPMSITVHQREQLRSRGWRVRLRPWRRRQGASQYRYARAPRIGPRKNSPAIPNQPFSNTAWIETNEECLRLDDLSVYHVIPLLVLERDES